MKALTLLIFAVLVMPAISQSLTVQKSNDAAREIVTPGGSSLLTSWMDVHLRAIRNCKIPSHHSRQLAYMGVALYESIVAAAPNYLSLAGQLNDYPATPAPPDTKDICWQASANAALASTMRFFYSDNPVTLQRIDSMEQACRKQLANKGFSVQAINAGAEYGSKVAGTVVTWSKTDGHDKISAPYTVPTGQGLYEPTPPAFIPPIQPYMGNCRTMVKGSTDNTIPPQPPAFSAESGSEFYKMVDEVYQTSLEKDESKVATALFWDDFPNGMTVTGGGHWESILKTVMTQMNLSLIEGARAFAALFITAQDASIGCFKAKYTYNLMRPVTYIQKYMNHKDWSPLIVTPPHPEYPAAHATVSMSAATILTHLLGDNIAFTDNTYAYRGYKEHHFANFKEAGKEAGMSRLYGGIHYKPSIQAGYEQGAKIANNIAHSLVFRKEIADR